MTKLVQVTLPYLCAGVIVCSETKIITQAAPILRWSEGRHIRELQAWVKKKKGEIKVV